jgi:hypothetical protein
MAEETKTEDMRIEIVERLSKLPNITGRIEALRASEKFADIGEALSPVTIATMKTEEKPISKQVQPIAKETRKNLRQRMGETGLEFLAFIGGSGNADDPEPAPQPIKDPLVCEHCGAKLKPNWTHCNNCGATVTPHQKTVMPEWIKPHHMHPLDFFAGAAVFVIWIAATLLMINSYGLGLWTIIGLGIFWIIFVIVYRVVAGGILD